MTNELFTQLLHRCHDDVELLDFTRKWVLHGTPFIFENREDQFYDFRKRISDKLEVSFNDVFISGSGKLGFSPYKGTEFSLDSDIDVTIVSTKKYLSMTRMVSDFQMSLRNNRMAITTRELAMYHKFLEYLAIGWIRPDKLPVGFGMEIIKSDWFNFFASISYGKSEVGDYKVNGGIFESYECYERYVFSGIKKLKSKLGLMEAQNG